MHDINPALSAFTNAVRTLYGNRLERIVLFGSFARGTAHEGSDIDVAVVLKGSIQAGLEIDQMSDILFEVNLAFGTFITIFPLASDRFHKERSPLLINIRKEGIAV